MTFRQKILIQYLYLKYVISDTIEDTLTSIFNRDKDKDKWVV